MPSHLIFGFVCVGLWLLFPKGFKYLVGSLVGACAGGFVWGIGTLVWLTGVAENVSWTFMGWTGLGCLTGGIITGCICAARG